MRKITRNAIQAFYSRKNFKSGNTKVVNNNGYTTLKLHGNDIACLRPDGTLRITNAGWETRTTKERLNGLNGVNIHQKDCQWYLNGNEWNGQWIEV